jgi:hypothetical protein
MSNKKPNIDELKLIQNVIARMGSNSFKIKGWAITLIVGALILKSGSYSILIAFLPLLVFWILDAHYLQLEKKFRKLYSQIVEGKLPEAEPPKSYIEFSLDISAITVKNKIELMFSPTIGLLYGLIGLLILGYFLLDFFSITE